MNIALLKRLADKNGNINIDTLCKIQETFISINNIRMMIEALEKEFKEKMAILKAEEVNIQSSCVHKLVSYYGDPSGGRDYENSCDICGKHL